MKIKELRKEKHKTQEEMSIFLKMTQSNYAKFEKNKTIAGLENLIKLADYFNVSLDYLCEREFKQPLAINQFGLTEQQKSIIEIIPKLTQRQLDKLEERIYALLDAEETTSFENKKNIKREYK